MKKIWVALLMAFVVVAGYSQDLSKKAKKEWDKAMDLSDKGKYEDATDIFEKLVKEYPTHYSLWKDYLVVSEREYLYLGSFTDNLFSNLTITTTTPEGDTLQGDTLAANLLNMLQGMKPSLNKFLDVCALGRNSVYGLEWASIYARAYAVDSKIEVSTESEEAYEQFQLAEKEFAKKNYHEAAKFYKKALDYDSSYYKAILYLGDAIWASDEPEMALSYYGKAAKMQPDLLEPKKYITDAFMSMHNYKKAEEACINGLLTYPDVNMFFKFQDIQEAMGNSVNLYFIPRFFLINDIDKKQGEKLEAPWHLYRQAKDLVESYTDKDGIISQNDETDITYLEVFSWDYMLRNIDKEEYPDLAFAFEMQEKGYLDCYVLFSLFNIHLYNQYVHFKEGNESKITDYLKTFLTE